MPEDPIILLSFINTKLRDENGDLSALCKRYDADETAVRNILLSAGYRYNPAINQFT